MLICSGRPIGVMCSEKQYENFVLHIEWMHMEAGGNSGVFVWSNARPDPRGRLPNGVEVQMLELDWPKLNTAQRRDAAGRLRPRRAVRRRRRQDDARQPARRAQHVDREPRQGQGRVEHLRRRRGRRRRSSCPSTASSSTASRRSTQKKGYFCLESEGGEIHFRNMRILELPPGVTTPEQTAPERK